MTFFDLAIVRPQNIKMSLYEVNKNDWVIWFRCFLMPVKRYKKWQLQMITLYLRNPYALRIQKMYLVWVTEPPFWSYSGSKWGHRPKIGCVTKNKRCPKSQTPFYFSSERPEIELIWTHRPGVQVDSILGQKLSLVLDTAIVLQQISKRWSTLAARNSTLNTLYPPLANIFWIEWSVFWVIFGIFWGQY